MHQAHLHESSEGCAVRVHVYRLSADERAKEQTLIHTRPSSSVRQMLYPWVISTVILVADQLSKFLIVGSFQPGDTRPLFPPVLALTYVQNTGAAFGLFKGQQVLFIVLSIVIVAMIGWELTIKRSHAAAIQWGCGLVLGGAVGNVIDRLRLGYVIDFLDVHVWPVFNIADSAITIGVILLMWHSLRHHE